MSHILPQVQCNDTGTGAICWCSYSILRIRSTIFKVQYYGQNINTISMHIILHYVQCEHKCVLTLHCIRSTIYDTGAIYWCSPPINRPSSGAHHCRWIAYGAFMEILTLYPLAGAHLSSFLPFFTTHNIFRKYSCTCVSVEAHLNFYRTIIAYGAWKFSPSSLWQVHISLIPFTFGTTVSSKYSQFWWNLTQ